MKILFKIITFSIFISNAFGQENEKLYPIKKGILWGYINKLGATVIKPQFFSVGKFSEGLAPVRLKGTYGYINKTGTFIISSKYDLAFDFENGIARVFIDGKTFFIDKTGTILFHHDYESITTFGSRSFAIIITKTGKYGIINSSGKLIVDTLFKRIHPFVNGLAVVEGLNHLPYTNDTLEKVKYEVGVIDSIGNWIVPYGRYSKIEDFKNHYAKVGLILSEETNYKETNHEAIIDEKGKERFVIPVKKFEFDYHNEGFYNEVAVVKIYSLVEVNVHGWTTKVGKEHMGVIDVNGNILCTDLNWKELTPFTFNRAFVLDGTNKWKLIDKSGTQIGDSSFEKILFKTYKGDHENLFTDGKALVKFAKGWVVIDTTGKVLTEPKSFNEIKYFDLFRVDNVVFFEDHISFDRYKSNYLYGFWNISNGVIINPTYHDIDEKNMNNDLIYVMKDGRKGYISQSGKKIWQEGKPNNLQDLNIDHLNRGYYYASSKNIKKLAGFGGWGKSNNHSKPASKKILKQGNQLQLIIAPNKKTKWNETYRGMKLLVVNGANDTMYFSAQDSRLYLKMQALNKYGEWKDIEYLPNSWCGNSYHKLFLAPNEYWEFATPIYQGEFKTKLRAQLSFEKGIKGEKDNFLYSNEIDGYINPGQFWNKKEYYPRGIMDPYFE